MPIQCHQARRGDAIVIGQQDQLFIFRHLFYS